MFSLLPSGAACFVSLYPPYGVQVALWLCGLCCLFPLGGGVVCFVGVGWSLGGVVVGCLVWVVYLLWWLWWPALGHL